MLFKPSHGRPSFSSIGGLPVHSMPVSFLRQMQVNFLSPVSSTHLLVLLADHQHHIGLGYSYMILKPSFTEPEVVVHKS